MKRLTSGRGVEVVYDGVGKETGLEGLDCLALRGMIVLFGNASGPVGPFDPLCSRRKGSLFLTRPTLFHYIADRASYEARAADVFSQVAAKRLDVRIDRSFPLAQAADAQRALESRQTSGSCCSFRDGGSGRRRRRVVAREPHGERAFEVVIGDLLSEPVDAIVNAANGNLAHGGGVAAAIARAAGPALEDEGERLVAARGPLAVGEAVVTTAGRLPFKGVIHAVGPHQGAGQEEDRLVVALSSALARASERAWASVAFPAVSSGIFAVPLDVCARAYVRAVRAFFAAHAETSVRSVRLVLRDGPLVALVQRELKQQR